MSTIAFFYRLSGLKPNSIFWKSQLLNYKNTLESRKFKCNTNNLIKK